MVKVTEKVQNSNCSLSGYLLSCWTFCNQTRHGNVPFRREKEKKKMSFDPRNPPGKTASFMFVFSFAESTAWRPFASCRRGWCGTSSPSSWESCGRGAAPARRRARPARRSPLKVGELCQARQWTVMTHSTHTHANPQLDFEGRSVIHSHTRKSLAGFWRAVSCPHPHPQLVSDCFSSVIFPLRVIFLGCSPYWCVCVCVY